MSEESSEDTWVMVEPMAMKNPHCVEDIVSLASQLVARAIARAMGDHTPSPPLSDHSGDGPSVDPGASDDVPMPGVNVTAPPTAVLSLAAEEKRAADQAKRDAVRGPR